MKIQYCSDLHLEFALNNQYILENPMPVSGDILILAGDIVPLHEEFLKNDFFDIISPLYKMIFWVPGNHEFYHKDMMELPAAMYLKVRENIYIVNNINLVYNKVHFIFSVLWSKISPQNARIVEQNVSDFDCILINDKKLRASDYNTLHTESLNFIKNCVYHHPGLPKIVVTHHLPSVECNLSINNNSVINEAFCVDLTDFIKECDVNFWLYGHSHFNQKPLYIRNTLLLTNQLGYVHLNEQESFKHNAYFVV